MEAIMITIASPMRFVFSEKLTNENLISIAFISVFHLKSMLKVT